MGKRDLFKILLVCWEDLLLGPFVMRIVILIIFILLMQLM